MQALAYLWYELTYLLTHFLFLLGFSFRTSGRQLQTGIGSWRNPCYRCNYIGGVSKTH